MSLRLVMLTLEANVPRRGKTTTSPSSTSRRTASRTGVRPMPSSALSASSSIGAPGGIASVIRRSRSAA